MFKHLLALAAAAGMSLSAQAVTVTQWNFNSVTADANTATGTISTAIGTGTASLVGGTTATFASGDTNGGSSDPATGDDSGWNTTAYATTSAGNKTRGAQFMVSTVGYKDVVFSFDLRHSNTSANTEVVQYTINGGTTWIDIATFKATAGDTWFKGRSVDLSSIDAADNNAAFGLRVVAGFGNVANTSYVASSPTGTYGSTGTWRFDMVTISAAPVPEPGTYALMLAGLAGVGFLARRRSI